MATIQTKSTQTTQTRQTTNQHALAWGVALALTGGLLFALTTFSLVSQSLLYDFDQVSSAWFAELRGEASLFMVEFLKILGQLGSDGTAIFLAGLLVYHLVRKNQRQLLLFLTGAIGGEIIWLVLIFLFDRPRPQAVTGFGGLDLPSYPSGHAELVVTVFMLLLYLNSRGLPSRFWGLAFAAFVLIWSILTGAIRLFLNVHYFTDVLAGYGLGLAWTGLTILMIDGKIFRGKLRR